MVHIGEADRHSDAGVFANSKLGHAIMNHHLPCRKPRNLFGSGEKFPYVLVADDTFPLRMNIVKPYSQCQMDIKRFIAIYRIGRAGRSIEHSFGIWRAILCIFHQLINAKVEHVESHTKEAVVLQNYWFLIINFGLNILKLTEVYFNPSLQL